MHFVSTIKAVLFEPTSFFRHLKKEEGLKRAFLYLAVVALVGTILTTGYTLLFPPSPESLSFFNSLLGAEKLQELEQQFVEEYTPRNILLNGFKNYAVIMVGSFILVALLHVWILLFGGRASYGKTYQLFAYSGTPSYLFSWVPYVGVLMVIYGIILLALGVQHTHGLSKTRAIWMVLIPVLLIVVFLAIVGAFLAAFFSTLQNTPLPA